MLVDGLPERLPDLPTGAWDEPPTSALVVPLPQQGQKVPLGFLVAGLNRYRALDEGYRSWVDLVAGHIAARIATARAYEQERLRAERLAELDQAKTTFFTNISHEFRTPLTLLLGPTEDALADESVPLAPEHRARFELVQRNGERLLRLVNSLLDFSRLEAGRTSARYEPVDLAKYTAELASSFVTATERVGLALRIDCPALPEPFWVDQEMWAKVVLNLLSNALKFTFEGSIEVSLRPDGDGAVLAVTDTGIGISPEDQALLFERFSRISGARSRSFEGSGIGLALVAELVALHGGGVDVRSEPDKGTTFLVRLPSGRAHLPADAVVDSDAVAPPPVDRQVRGFMAEALRWSDGSPSEIGGGTSSVPEQGAEDGPGPPPPHLRRRRRPADPGRRRQRRHARLRVPAAGAGLPGPHGPRRPRGARPRSDRAAGPAAHRRDDAGHGRLRAGRRPARGPGRPPRCRSSCSVPARARKRPSRVSMPASDDYLVKPFSARELLARVRANLELDRVRRTRARLERSQALLDQAQRLARVGSWELELDTGRVSASVELVRQLDLSAEDLAERGFEHIVSTRVHPDDQEPLRAAIAAAAEGEPLDVELRLIVDGGMRTYRVIGELERDEHGRPVRLRGSQQDVTDQHLAQDALAAATAAREAADRETALANELQASLLPQPSFDPDPLQVATYYRAGVEGTQVGGDWYDVIELGAGRTALVMGDVMGRGVQAAAVMGQLRAAVRAYARLDLAPSDILEYLDGLVRDLGDDQIVTCLYAVYDPGERRLVYANAGHLPPCSGFRARRPAC